MSKLKIALQKSGRLNEKSLQLLASCGIRIDNGKDQLKVEVANFPLEILFLRNSDIPQYVEDGVADIAIVGENILIEQRPNVQKILPLNFSKCRVSLAVPKNEEVKDVKYYQGKKIATSYPNTLQQFLDKNNVQAEIHVISGSVEIAPNIGLADAICDIVSTGSTLFKNGLIEDQILLESQAVLIKSNSLSSAKNELLEQLIFRMKAVLKGKSSKYILMNVPNNKIEAVNQLLPVLKSPTVLPLSEEGWSSLHSVIEENQFWEVIDALKQAGAQGILVVPIDKIVL